MVYPYLSKNEIHRSTPVDEDKERWLRRIVVLRLAVVRERRLRSVQGCGLPRA
jgi:hypothetical protein